jgi:HEAT repeat protein
MPRGPRVRALSDTLAVASPDECDALAVELIELAIGPGELEPIASVGPIHALVRPIQHLARRHREQRTQPARLELVRRWSVLSDHCKETALAIGRSGWDDAIDSLVGAEATADRLAVTQMVSDLGQPDKVGALVALINDADEAIAKAAEAGLVRAAGRVAGVRVIEGRSRGSDRDLCETGADVSASARRTFERDLLRAIAGVNTHHRRGVLLAALIALGEPRLGDAADEDRPLITWLNNRDDPSHMNLRSVFRRAREPMVRARAWHWLTREPIAAAALDRLARAETLEEHEVVLKQGHLATHPVRQRRLGMVKVRPRVTARESGVEQHDGTASTGLELVRWPSAGPIPSASMVRSLSAGARRQLPRWASALKMDAASRQRAIDPLLSDPSELVRHAAVRAASVRALVDFCFDSNPCVAATALLRASNVGEKDLGRDPGMGLKLAQRLERHPSPMIRQLATQERERVDPWGASVASRVCARRQLRDDRDTMLSQMHERITSGDASQRVRAIALCRMLNLSETLEVELQTCLLGRSAWSKDDLRVAATAVTALGDAGTPTARRLVEDALTHAGNRVRANAVEALSHCTQASSDLAVQDPGVYASMIELKSDANHRVRANAIRALLSPSAGAARSRIYEPAAVEGLVSMLSDDRRMHRVAGLWLTGKMIVCGGAAGIGSDLSRVVSRVADLAGADDDSDVRERASSCARMLLESTKSRWTQRAVDVAADAEMEAVL